MRQVRFWLRTVFSYSPTETNGFIVLCVIILLFLLIPLIYPVLFPPQTFDHASDRVLLDSVAIEIDKRQTANQPNHYSEKAQAPVVAVSLFDFDPNQLDTAQWQSLGLPKYLAERIIKYRSKGGKFRVKGDVKKIYGFPEDLYQRLYNHILLPDSTWQEKKVWQNVPRPHNASPAKNKPAQMVENFDINQADTLQLATVRGIGPALSRRIVKYRDLLGGFVSHQQVYEVYGLDSLVVEELFKKGYLIDNQPLHPLKINQATEKELDAHPYISPRLAKVIVAYRIQHGNFHSVESLAQVKILDEGTLKRLAPYLSFE